LVTLVVTAGAVVTGIESVVTAAVGCVAEVDVVDPFDDEELQLAIVMIATMYPSRRGAEPTRTAGV